MGQENCVSRAFRTHNLQSSPDLVQASGQGALTTAPYQPTTKREITTEKEIGLFNSIMTGEPLYLTGTGIDEGRD